MTNDLVYIYCLTNRPPDLHESMEFKGLKSLMFGDFYAVVKYVAESEFSEENFKRNVSDLEWKASNSRNHVKVINRLMDQNTVLPFKFGTIYTGVENLKKFISDYSDSLFENFHLIEGTEEWGIKIYCDRKSLSEQIDELSEETAGLEKQIMASSPGKAFLLKRKKSELVENEMDRFCKKCGQNYYEEFRKLGTSAILNNLLPKEFTGREDTMILNATFLVVKTKVDDFTNTVDKHRREDGITGFFIETTGPGPPFSFVGMKENQ